jgi:nematocidal protein AidA
VNEDESTIETLTGEFMATGPIDPTRESAKILTSAHRQINVLVVIDTELLKKYVADNKITPSLQADKPTSMAGRAGQYMVATGSRLPATGQGTGSVGFTANPGDTVVFCGESGYANAEDAVIVYKIAHKGGSTILTGFRTLKTHISGAASPDSSKPDGLPAVNAPADFLTLAADVSGLQTGDETFYIYFGLYELDSTGQKQVLFGYFDCDPTITVRP